MGQTQSSTVLVDNQKSDSRTQQAVASPPDAAPVAAPEAPNPTQTPLVLPQAPHPALSRSVPVSALISAATTTSTTPPSIPSLVSTQGRRSTETIRTEPEQSSPRSPGFLDNIRQGYENIILALVRPTRAIYTERELGPRGFTAANGRRVTRYDFLIKNRRQQSLVCSHWRFDESKHDGIAPANCVIYCHGNSSCRASAIGDCLFPCLNEGASVFAFDFSGSGGSDGDYISLGVNESDDIEDIVAYVRHESLASRILLWGRSMGATSCLLYATRDQTLAGVIADSPFSDLNRLCYELVEVGSSSMQVNLTLMQVLFSLVIRLVRSSTKEKTGADIFDPKYRAIEAVKSCVVPVFFVAGDRDRLISIKHSQDLYKIYGSNAVHRSGSSPPSNVMKYMHVVKGGDHNEPRPEAFLNEAQVFLDHVFSGKELPKDLKEEIKTEQPIDVERDLQLAIERSLQSS